MEENRGNITAYLIGGLIGAGIGVLAAYLIENAPDLEEGENPFSRRKLSKIGLGTISILWGLINPGRGPNK